jgi:hypothetical protein
VKEEYKKFTPVEQLILKGIDEIKDELKKKCGECPTTTGMKYHWITLIAACLVASSWMYWLTTLLYAHTTNTGGN